MDFPDKEFFDRLMQLTEENNRMLRRIRRAAFWTGISRIIYWIILIGISVGAFYYIQPYIQQFWDTYKALESTGAKVQGIVNPFSKGS